jgi:hypothetical protein
MQSQLQVRAVPSPSFQEARIRSRRWHFFQIVFVFTYLGIILDVVTTAIGSSVAGSARAYEQNPIGGALIGGLGWIGILGAMTALMLVAYVSLRVVHTRVQPGWIRFFNILMLVIGAVRWLAVVTALAYIVRMGH